MQRALWAARRATQATVIAIEPAARTAALLNRNLTEHDISSRVRTLQVALGASRGRGVLTWYPRMPGNSTLHPEEKEADGALCFRPERREKMLAVGSRDECEVNTLSHVLGEVTASVALVKIDVEGAEIDVLAGIDEADWPRLQQVVLEANGASRRAEARQILSRHYEVVGEVIDDEMALCGLDRAIVYARCPRGGQYGIQ